MRRPPAAAALAISLSLFGGCPDKKRDEPEYLTQQKKERARLATIRAKERALERRGQTIRLTRDGAVITDGGITLGAKSVGEKFHESQWPPKVQRAFRLLYRASFNRIPQTARLLAQQGLAAADAMRALLSAPHQPRHKKGPVALLLGQLYMFRPDDLAKMGRRSTLPLLQRAAIDNLARLRNPHCIKLLDEVLQAQPLMKKFIEGMRRRPGLEISTKQIKTLDMILHDHGLMKVKGALETITPSDKEMRKALLMILASPVTRMLTHAMVVERLLAMAGKNRRTLRAYAEPGFPRMLRAGAAQALVKLDKKADRTFLRLLSENRKDPMARAFRVLLKGPLLKGKKKK